MSLNSQPPNAEEVWRSLNPHTFPSRAEIEAAFEALPILPEERWRVAGIINELCIRGFLLMRGGGDVKVPPHDRPCSLATAKKELTEPRDRAQALAKKIREKGGTTRARQQLVKLLRGLHGPTVRALEDTWIFNIKSIAPDVLREPRGWVSRLEQDCVSLADMTLLVVVAVLAEEKVENSSYPTLGRPPHRPAHIISEMLAKAYWDLTGLEPTATTLTYGDHVGRADGPYVRFVEGVFRAVGLEGRAAWSDAVRAGHQLRGRGRKK